MSNLLEYALKYAALGWKVFPCLPHQKVPACAHGVKDATTDERQIREWWGKNPSFNIAVACGLESGVYVIDVDVQESSGIDGWESISRFAGGGNVLPDTVMQHTPRGGAHFFFSASIPPVNRNSFAPGIDIRSSGYYVVLAPSIHPNGGVYAWGKGCAPWDRKPADYPAFMRPTTRAPWAELTQPAKVERPTAAAPVPPTDDTLRRASAYLAECDTAVQGQAGHNKLLWAAVAMVHGFLLSDDQAYELLAREYNPRCVPPWDLSTPKDEKDFRRKISEARKLTPAKPLGWLIEDQDYVAPDISFISAIDIDKLISSASNPMPLGIDSWLRQDSDSQSPAATYTNELQFLCKPTGYLGELCSWLNATAIREQPFLSLGCSLAFMGALFGRKVKDALGGRTNLYAMGVAPSSAGKAHQINQIRRLCAVAECTDLLGGDDFASDSAIEIRMAKYPATLFLCDEIGYLLSHIRSGKSQHHAKIVPLLMKLYSSAGSIYKGREFAEEGKQRTIVEPLCCIYGTSTPERFVSGISPDELQDGWLSRCLVFSSSDIPRKMRDRRECPVPTTLSDLAHQWFIRQITRPGGSEDIKRFVVASGGKYVNEEIPAQLVVPTTEGAERLFIAFDDESSAYGKKNPHLACLWGKGEENARRIALIVASGESFSEPVITEAIADYSCRLVRYLLTSFGNDVASKLATCLVDERKQRILAFIESAGVGGCSKRDITRRTQWANGRDRAAMIADLIEAEEVIAHKSLSGKTVNFWTVKNFLKYAEQHPEING
ncbi:MAG: bifunctional DNA primase/polymerase [Patescibacteria group bacterium]